MVRTTVFPSNGTPAARRPDDVARRVITAANESWDEVFDAPGADLGPREQPSAQTRDAF